VRRAGVALRGNPARLVIKQLIEQLIKMAKNQFKVLRWDRSEVLDCRFTGA
jgi:hypothetical protein